MKLLFSFILIALSISIAAQPSDSTKYQSVGPEDFLTLMRFEEKAVIIDVRMPVEYRKERIENAVNIPVLKTAKKISAAAGYESVLLIYCTTGYRSIRVASKYYDLGYHNVYNLEGGIEAWKKKGLPVLKKRRGKE